MANTQGSPTHPKHLTHAPNVGQALRVLSGAFASAGVFSLVANLLMLTPTLYMLQIYDRVLISRSELTLLAVSLVALFLFALTALAEWARARLLVRIGVRLDALLAHPVFDASFAAHWQSRDALPTRALGDLTELRQFMTGHGMLALFDAPWAPIYIAVMFMLHPWLGGVAIGFVLVQSALAWLGHSRTVAPNLAAARAQGDADAYLHGKLRNVDVVEAMGMRRPLQQRWATRLTQALLARAHAQDLSHRLTAWSKWVRYGQQSLVLAVGAVLVLGGELSPGAMIAANVLMARALTPIDTLVGSWRSLLGARAAHSRLAPLLAATPHNSHRAAAPTHTSSGQLVLRAVSATVPGRERPLLQGIDLTLEPGQLTLVMGPSGSGKSTLARVVLGIWPDVQGDAHWGGLALGGSDRAALGPPVGYLPQDVSLFEGTIAENIARLGPVDSERVIAASRSTGLHDTILRLAQGYDTPIGLGGSLLSGGQRQRIALARALYGQPALLVLDEPNAHLDDAGENALLQALQVTKARGQTVLLISHRASVLKLADQLVLLKDGQVQWSGPGEHGLAWLQAQRDGTPPTPAVGNRPGLASPHPA